MVVVDVSCEAEAELVDMAAAESEAVVVLPIQYQSLSSLVIGDRETRLWTSIM